MRKASVQQVTARQDGATMAIAKPQGGNLLMKKLLAKNRAAEEAASDTSRDDSGKRSSIAPSGSRPSISAGSISTARMSLGGLLASRRFAKKLMNKAAEKRESTVADSVPSVLYEPTYRLEPKVKFNPGDVLNIVRDVLDNRVKDMKYNPRIAPNMNRILGDEVKDRVKKLNYERYRIVVLVMIGEKQGQGVQITSRCSWDDKLDSFVTHTCQNKHIFCTCIVYGTYKE